MHKLKKTSVKSLPYTDTYQSNFFAMESMVILYRKSSTSVREGNNNFMHIQSLIHIISKYEEVFKHDKHRILTDRKNLRKHQITKDELGTIF